MERDFETVMIEQCAPVLAGLKPAGLFRYETRNRADLARRVAGWNAQLNPKGLQVRVLQPAAVLRGGGGGFPPRDRGISGLSAGGCGGLYPPPGQVFYLLRVLEVLRRPRRRPAAL